MAKYDDLKKLIKLTGERAKLEAKANDTYVIYKDPAGKIVKEFPNGVKEYLQDETNGYV